MITCSIDVSLLDKARFKRVKKRNGSEGVYCDLVLIETPNSEFGDFMVKQGISKEDREKGVKMPILGNAKRFGARGGQPAQHQASDDAPVPF